MDDLIATLRRKGRVEVDEHVILYGGEWMRLKPGDRYLGQHQGQKPELLTCRRLEFQRRSSGRTVGKLFPKERKDSRGKTPRLYDLEEVIKVTIRDNPNYDPDKKELIDAGPEPESPATPDPTDGGSTEPERPVGPGSSEGASSTSEGAARPSPRPTAVPKPGPAPVPGDPRERAGRTDYTKAARKEDE